VRFMKRLKQQKTNRIKDQSKIAFFCAFCLPSLLLYLLFSVYPIINSIYTSFFDWSGYGELTSDAFIGIQNYLDIIRDQEFLAAIKNDFLIILGRYRCCV